MFKEHSAPDGLACAPIPEDYEILDANALAQRLGLSRNTIFTYLQRGSFHRVPKPDRRLSMGPIWYEISVRNWEQQDRKLKPVGRPAKNHQDDRDNTDHPLLTT